MWGRVTGLLILLLTMTTVNAQQLIGQSAPDFALPDHQGNVKSLKHWQGKVLVINFWATWCSPCLKEMPMFNRVQQDFKEDDVVFIGIAVDSKANVRQFLNKLEINYPILVGDMEALKLITKYGNKTGTLPYTVFVDRNGKIRSIANGLLSRSTTMSLLEKIL